MQSQNGTPQGLAGLAQQRQQPQMPNPGNASPMAGLGSVDDRVSAYQGNTKPLEQRYAMGQDLLDLLALQKIKSQKDAAARQMQLQMAQQNAQNGQANMTVAQQREQEVNELTKNEMAQQRGDTAQKQTSDLMAGIAAAPGANAAAQPNAMAAGGIVGYAGGGAVGYSKGGDVDAARERRKVAQQKLYSYGLRQRQQDPEGYAAAEKESQEAQEALNAAEKELTGGPVGAMLRPMGAPVPRPAAAAAPTPEAEATAVSPEAPPAAPQAAPPAAPKPPAPSTAAAPGIAGLPPAGGASPVQLGVAGPANALGAKLEDIALKSAQVDPAARQLSEEERIQQKTALTPTQRKVYEEGIAGLEKMYQMQYDPERLRQEGLKRALIGAGGRRYGEFAGAATAGMDYDEQQRAAKLKEFGDVQKARTGLIDIDRANVKEGIGAGQKAYEQSSMTQRQGLESGRGLYGDDVKSRDTLYSINVQSKDKALDREIDKLKVSLQAQSNQIQREGYDLSKAQTIYSAATGRVQELERKLDQDFAKQYGMLLVAEQNGKMDPAQKQQLDVARAGLDVKKDAIRKELEPVLASARSKLGITSTQGWGELKTK